MTTNIHNYTTKQLTSENWEDLVQLFGTHGAYGGCWCTFFRQTRQEYRENSGEKNKQFFHSIVNTGQPVGLLAYSGNEPIGWCAVSPRENYSALERSRLYKRVDDKQVWSITCFFTASDFRRKGVSNFLIQEAIQFVRKNGGKIIEAYPENPATDAIPDGDAYTGILEVFIRLGFQIVPDRDPANPVARYFIE